MDESEDKELDDSVAEELADALLGEPHAHVDLHFGADLRDIWKSERGLGHMWGIPSVFFEPAWTTTVTQAVNGSGEDGSATSEMVSAAPNRSAGGGLRSALLDGVGSGRVAARVDQRSEKSETLDRLSTRNHSDPIPNCYLFNCYDVAQLPEFGWPPTHAAQAARIAEAMAQAHEEELGRLQAAESLRKDRPFQNQDQFIRDNIPLAKNDLSSAGKDVNNTSVARKICDLAQAIHGRRLALNSVVRRVRAIENE